MAKTAKKIMGRRQDKSESSSVTNVINFHTGKSTSDSFGSLVSSDSTNVEIFAINNTHMKKYLSQNWKMFHLEREWKPDFSWLLILSEVTSSLNI